MTIAVARACACCVPWVGVGMCLSAIAAPLGGTLSSGTATIASAGQITTVSQSSDRAVIDWSSFNISASEIVNFRQPGSGSATLNRIHSDNASQILGQINANGSVFLVNPNGFMIGKTATVNVGGLMASTANIGNDVFMSGQLRFDKSGSAYAKIVNDGTINSSVGGFVALAAPNIRNSGVISARLGRVALGSGDTFTLDLYGDSLVNVSVDRAALANIADTKGVPLARYIRHDGTISAAGGRVELLAATAQNLVSAIVNLGGTTRAHSADRHNGSIRLTAGEEGDVTVIGLADVSGDAGGSIRVLGRDISLVEGAAIDASGHLGGGLVNIGDAERTRKVTVSPSAKLIADARELGNGGSIKLSSKDRTEFSGKLSASGGRIAGEAGSAEISSSGAIVLGSTDINLTAAHGQSGTLTLDPADLTIARATDSANVVSDYTLFNLLARGNNVSFSATNDINVDAAIEGRGGLAGGAVTLSADHDLLINSNIVTNHGAVRLSAGHVLTMKPDTIISSGDQPISLSGKYGVTSHHLITSGNINIVSTNGAIDARKPLGFTDKNSGRVQPVGNVTINAASPDGTTSSAHGVTIAGVLANGDVAVTGHAITLHSYAQDNKTTSGSGGIHATGAVNLAADNDISLGADVVAGAGIGLMSRNGGISSKTLDTKLLGDVGSIALQAAGSIEIAGNVLSRNGSFRADSSAGGFGITGGIDLGSADAAIAAAGNLGLQDVVARSLMATTNGNGSITLHKSLGGDSATAPVVRSLRLDSASDIFLAGVNLAGVADGIALSAVSKGQLKIMDTIAVNDGAILLGSTSNRGSAIHLYGDVLARNGGSISLNNDLVVHNFHGINAMTNGLTSNEMAHFNGGSVIAIDNTTNAPTAVSQMVLLNMARIENDKFAGTRNSLIIKSMSAAGDQSSGKVPFIKHMDTTKASASGTAVYYTVPSALVATTDQAVHPEAFSRHANIAGTFFLSGNLPETISGGAGGSSAVVSNQFGNVDGPHFVLTISPVPLGQVSTPSAYCVGSCKNGAPDPYAGNIFSPMPAAVLDQQTTLEGLQANQTSSNTGGMISSSSGAPLAPIGNGSVSLALTIAFPGVVVPGSTSSSVGLPGAVVPGSTSSSVGLPEVVVPGSTSSSVGLPEVVVPGNTSSSGGLPGVAAPANTIYSLGTAFRPSDFELNLTNPEPAQELVMTHEVASTSSNGVQANLEREAPLEESVVFGGRGVIAGMDLGRSSGSLSGAGVNIFDRRHCVAMADIGDQKICY